MNHIKPLKKSKRQGKKPYQTGEKIKESRKKTKSKRQTHLYHLQPSTSLHIPLHQSSAVLNGRNKFHAWSHVKIFLSCSIKMVKFYYELTIHRIPHILAVLEWFYTVA